jgi:ligand-binding SRPBCC domain-containing protein
LRQLLPRLKRWGNGIDHALEQGSFIQLDADDLASRILSDGVARWRSSLVQTLESAAAATRRPRPRVAVFGECAGILWAAGHVERAIDLEQLGVEIVKTMPVDIMCTYPLPPADHDHAFKGVCAHHRTIAIR